ncbi:hypothetical protein ACHAXA_000117 [Cyclostephanos tholiformis]|uniref:DUF6824 domain-containing protein n=1 Tax=Cyclostephanos tholiformis TaxID=382380 RepID=A0ABD3RXX7_9STRA
MILKLTEVKMSRDFHAMDWIDLLLRIGINLEPEALAETTDPSLRRNDLTVDMDYSLCSSTPPDCRHQYQETTNQPISAPDRFDVVCGFGQGIQRLSGNKTYRELVSANKRIYARCHKSDKGKVTKGIVDAIREVGGRFLEYNDQTRTYHDIGDKRARKKTSQALREGQSNIRRQMYSDLAAGRNRSGPDANLPRSSNVPLPAERYF